MLGDETNNKLVQANEGENQIKEKIMNESKSLDELKNNHRNELVGGGVLILLGIVFLLGQWLPDAVGMLIPLFIGLMLLFWGVLVRHVGPIIPGGIMTGIGIGVLLTEQFFPTANEAIFLFGFASGWVLITVASALFTDETHWWPLIVAAIMVVVGAAATFGGILLTLLSWAGTLWPIALILVGLYLVIRHTVYEK